MRKITLPDWVKKLPDDARLNAKEVVALFGYAASTDASALVQRGALPAPTEKMRGFCREKLQWSVADLKKYERECKIVVDK